MTRRFSSLSTYYSHANENEVESRKSFWSVHRTWRRFTSIAALNPNKPVVVCCQPPCPGGPRAAVTGDRIDILPVVMPGGLGLLLHAERLGNPDTHGIAGLGGGNFGTLPLDDKALGGREVLVQADLCTSNVTIGGENLDQGPEALQVVDGLDGCGCLGGGGRGCRCRLGAVIHEPKTGRELVPIGCIDPDCTLAIEHHVRVQHARVPLVGFVLDGFGRRRDGTRIVGRDDHGPLDDDVRTSHLDTGCDDLAVRGGLLLDLPRVVLDVTPGNACCVQPRIDSTGSENRIEGLQAREMRGLRVAGRGAARRDRAGRRRRDSRAGRRWLLGGRRGRSSGGLHRWLCRRGAFVIPEGIGR